MFVLLTEGKIVIGPLLSLILFFELYVTYAISAAGPADKWKKIDILISFQ